MKKLLLKMNSTTKAVAMMEKVLISFYTFATLRKYFVSINCEGLSRVNETKLDPKTCTERICHSSENLLYAHWISSKVSLYSVACFYLFLLYFQAELGCDCCEVNGKLVPDKYTWVVVDKTFGKNFKHMYIPLLS